MMEDPACDRERLFNPYRQFEPLNILVSGWGRVYREFIRPILAETGRATLLDVGAGGGDIPLRLLRLAAADGFELEATAIDSDPRCLEYVRERHRDPAARFELAGWEDLIERGARFDIVISNHLLHHIPDEALLAFLAGMERLARRVILINDIERGNLSYFAFAALIVPFFRRSFVAADGLTSIRRSYTAAELRRLLPPGWSVRRRFPSHLLLVHRKA